MKYLQFKLHACCMRLRPNKAYLVASSSIIGNEEFNTQRGRGDIEGQRKSSNQRIVPRSPNTQISSTTSEDPSMAACVKNGLATGLLK